MEDLDNKWILNATSINQDCREKDGNNPVTLGLENMRGVRLYFVYFVSYPAPSIETSISLSKLPSMLIWVPCVRKLLCNSASFLITEFMRSDKSTDIWKISQQGKGSKLRQTFCQNHFSYLRVHLKLYTKCEKINKVKQDADCSLT